VVVFLASPANPQGAVASHAYLERLLEMTRAHGAYLFADECYSEIYLGAEKPTGILEVARGDYSGLLSFNSLSKRSSLPGMRVGFVAGDCGFPQGLSGLPRHCRAAGARAAAGGGGGGLQ